MKDFILKHIEWNEAYHDRKEKMAWIASSVYFTFSVFVLKWLFEHRYFFANCRQSWFITIALLFIYICALCFISLQFKMRWDSVNKSDALTRVLCKMKKDDYPSSFPSKLEFEKDQIKSKEKFKDNDKKENKTIIAHKRSGWIIAILTIFFWSAPIVYIFLREMECIKTVAPKRKIWIILLLTIFLWLVPIGSIVLRVIECIETVHKRNIWIILVILSYTLIFYIVLRVIECIKRKWQKKQKKIKLKINQRYRTEIDQRYRTEIPTYTISTIFLLAQLYLIWSKEINPHLDNFLKLLRIGT